MQPLICGKIIDKYIIASHLDKLGAVINKEKYDELVKLSKTNSTLPLWIEPLLKKIGIEMKKNLRVNDYVFIKETSSYGYGRVSYEITEGCNYDCRHCYLGKKNPDTLDCLEKEKIIYAIEKSGCLWLQITGGEPLIDKDFPHIYNLAHSLGMLITLSTNGSKLINKKISKLLEKKPPYRLTISLYGATKKSYESLTQRKGSFKKFIAGLDWAKRTKVKTRLNIIVTNYNELEIEDMINIAKRYDFEYFVYYSLSPTLKGSRVPIEFNAINCSTKGNKNLNIKDKKYIPCHAGNLFFHINSAGKASICKTVRIPNVDFVSTGKSVFNKLSQISKMLLSCPSDCTICSQRKKCTTCPLLYKFYKKSGYLPSSICGKIK